MGEEVAAFIRPATGVQINKDELFAYVPENLAAHKTPRHWFQLDAFPLTGSGKIQKYKLRESRPTTRSPNCDEWRTHRTRCIDDLQGHRIEQSVLAVDPIDQLPHRRKGESDVR